MVFVPALYKKKELDTGSVYLKMDFNKVVPFCDIPILESYPKGVRNKDNKYFYLYYELKETKDEAKEAEVIQNALIEYLLKDAQSNK